MTLCYLEGTCRRLRHITFFDHQNRTMRVFHSWVRGTLQGVASKAQREGYRSLFHRDKRRLPKIKATCHLIF